jgi:hypothetical protein
MVLISIESAINTRRFVRTASHVGNTRSGFDPMFNSSRLRQAARERGKEVKKFAEISKANKEWDMGGRTWWRKDGRWFGVADAPKRRWVVSITGGSISFLVGRKGKLGSYSVGHTTRRRPLLLHERFLRDPARPIGQRRYDPIRLLHDLPLRHRW